MIQLASRIWNSYLTVLNKHPLRVQMIQTGTIMTLGDIFAQKVIEKKEDLDVKRMLRFTVLGSCIVGPMIRSWLLILEKMFGPTTRNIKGRVSMLPWSWYNSRHAPIRWWYFAGNGARTIKTIRHTPATELIVITKSINDTFH